MSRSLLQLLLTAVGFAGLLLSCNESKGTAENTNSDSSVSNRSAPSSRSAMTRELAKEGDTVWVLVNHVKGDKREQFERFVHEVFWDGSAKLNQNEQRVFKQTRVLHPTRQENDGSYKYIFIMDPVLKGGNYDIGQLMEKIYGPEKAKEYGKLYDEAVLGEQTSYVMVQSRH